MQYSRGMTSPRIIIVHLPSHDAGTICGLMFSDPYWFLRLDPDGSQHVVVTDGRDGTPCPDCAAELDTLARSLFDARAQRATPFTDEEWEGWKSRMPTSYNRLVEDARNFCWDD